MTHTAHAARLAVAALLAAAPALAQAPTSTTKSINQPQRETVGSAPTLQIFAASAGQSDLCIGEASGAYGSSVLAVTLDVDHRDLVCSLLRQSKWAADLGDPALSREIMCGSPDWRLAAARVGRPCAAPARRAWWRVF